MQEFERPDVLSVTLPAMSKALKAFMYRLGKRSESVTSNLNYRHVSE